MSSENDRLIINCHKNLINFKSVPEFYSLSIYFRCVCILRIHFPIFPMCPWVLIQASRPALSTHITNLVSEGEWGWVKRKLEVDKKIFWVFWIDLFCLWLWTAWHFEANISPTMLMTHCLMCAGWGQPGWLGGWAAQAGGASFSSCAAEKLCEGRERWATPSLSSDREGWKLKSNLLLSECFYPI